MNTGEKEKTAACTGCGCSTEAVTAEFRVDNQAPQKAPKKKLDIEFLYLDLNVCQPCRGSESNLDQALAEVAGVLEKTGVQVNVRKIHIRSYEQALALGFVSSPTIRVNGRDVQLEVKENHCSSCSELSGKNTDCRVWEYQGQVYQAAPKAMIMEAVLREVYGGRESPDTVYAPSDKITGSLENLKRFFEPRAENEETTGAAAGAEARLGCCGS